MKNMFNVFKRIKTTKQQIAASEKDAKDIHNETLKLVAKSKQNGDNLVYKLEKNGITLQLMATMGRPHD